MEVRLLRSISSNNLWNLYILCTSWHINCPEKKWLGQNSIDDLIFNIFIKVWLITLASSQRMRFRKIYWAYIYFTYSLSNCERPNKFLRAKDIYLRYVSISWSPCSVSRVWVLSHSSILLLLTHFISLDRWWSNYSLTR